jgi:hypothetical protein
MDEKTACLDILDAMIELGWAEASNEMDAIER